MKQSGAEKVRKLTEVTYGKLRAYIAKDEFMSEEGWCLHYQVMGSNTTTVIHYDEAQVIWKCLEKVRDLILKEGLANLAVLS